MIESAGKNQMGIYYLHKTEMMFKNVRYIFAEKEGMLTSETKTWRAELWFLIPDADGIYPLMMKSKKGDSV